LESLGPDPGPHFLKSLDLDPDPHFNPDQKFFFCFLNVLKQKIVGKNEDLDPDPQIFHTLDPDPYPQIFQTLYPDLYEMDADSKRCPKTAEPDAKHRKFTTFFRFPGCNVPGTCIFHQRGRIQIDNFGSRSYLPGKRILLVRLLWIQIRIQKK